MPLSTFELTERFGKVRVADVIDALDRYGFHDEVLIPPLIRPLYPGIRMAGAALTVKATRAQGKIPPMSPSEYERYADEWYERRANYDHFMKLASRGTVLVVDLDGYVDVGFWGSMIALVAKQGGVEGIVLDGGCRDSQEIRKIGFPVFCRGTGRTEVIGRVEVHPQNVNVPLVMGGAAVTPGDIIVGDDDGVVIVPKAVRSEVLLRAERQLSLDREAQRPYLERMGLNL
jgi:4-hydroxy-4-methyl-2-oxoglutarate aldolase